MKQPPPPPPPPPSHPSQPPQQPPYGGWGGQSALPAFPPAGGWASSNADLLQPVRRRPLVAALISLAAWTATTFLAVMALGALFIGFVDALSDNVNEGTSASRNSPDGAQIAGYAAIIGAIAFGLHYLVGTALLLLLRLGDAFASWSTVVQGLLVWAVSAPLTLVLVFVVGSAVV